jgi:hypothetical protein
LRDSGPGPLGLAPVAKSRSRVGGVASSQDDGARPNGNGASGPSPTRSHGAPSSRISMRTTIEPIASRTSSRPGTESTSRTCVTRDAETHSSIICCSRARIARSRVADASVACRRVLSRSASSRSPGSGMPAFNPSRRRCCSTSI